MPKSKQQTPESPRSHLPWKDWFELFLLQKKAQGLADRTISDYQYHVPAFFKRYESELFTTDNLKLAVMKYLADSGSLSPIPSTPGENFSKAFSHGL